LQGAELAYRKVIAINAQFDGNHYFITRILLTRGQLDLALKEIQPEPASDAKDAGLAMVHHAMQRQADSDSALARLIRASGETWPYAVATVYAYRGQLNEAFEWLDKSRLARDSDLLMGIRGDPEFAPLRTDPRYKALLRELNLPE
jgi:adenylate cyclase